MQSRYKERQHGSETIITARLEKAQRLTPFGLDMKVLLTIEATAAADGFTGEKVMAISKKFDTDFPAPQRSAHDVKR